MDIVTSSDLGVPGTVRVERGELKIISPLSNSPQKTTEDASVEEAPEAGETGTGRLIACRILR